MNLYEQRQAIAYFFRTRDYGLGHRGAEVIAPDPNKVYLPPIVEPDEEPARTSVGERVSATWERAEVREARNTRDGVSVTINGVVSRFRSTKAAFIAFELPLNGHGKFRAELKAAKEKIFVAPQGDLLFKIIPLEEV